MEIELRKITYNPRLDEDSFAANIFINGQKAAIANRKNGRLLYYAVDDRGIDLVEQAQQYLKKQPREKGLIDGKEPMISDLLSDKIEHLFATYLMAIERKKFDKKVELMQKRNIVIGEPGRYMRTVPTKTQVNLLVTEGYKDLILDILTNKVLPSMSGNEKILNTNIPVIILKETGLKTEQYLITENGQGAKKTQKKSQGIKP
ncbi:MAG: hypothetical protein BGO31_20600 [Bacteroidetes bacterium 43-16]|uniref:hypothetical protein n=1 Tax=uncultured Dysgonomonas sp. TaxID=206096 RepID=UPI00092AC127|nr:hypothetical protein [uncultured Dysgonomonas sp.]OJV55333.1 MAG: hypothetical protein BGO31_20600 [Bacteroidetes bacterium 43-16]